MTPVFAAAAALIAAAQGAPTAGAAPSLAAKAFADMCLGNAGSAEAARTAAGVLGFRKGPVLPPLGSGGALESYDKAPLELVIREAKSGSFGCIVLFEPEASASNEAIAQAVTALADVRLLSSKGSAKSWRATWTPLAAPKGSKVYLTINHGTGKRTAILSLESKAKK